LGCGYFSFNVQLRERRWPLWWGCSFEVGKQGISTFQVNTSASYCLYMLPPPAPSLVDSCCLDYLSFVVNERTSWFSPVFLCLQAKPWYHRAVPKCTANQDADVPAALPPKAGKPEEKQHKKPETKS